jgi:hypothetical protein
MLCPRSWARHGDDLLSYINQVDDRMDNLMEGIKENEVLTKILAAKIICCVQEVALRRNIDLPRMNPIFRRKLYIYLSLEKYSII